MTLARSLMLVMAALLIVAATLALIGLLKVIGPHSTAVQAGTPRLGAYGADISQTSVSGVSSGGAMAMQMHVAHSSIMRGIGVIAGVAYDCADSSLPLLDRITRGVGVCLAGGFSADAAFSIARTTFVAGISGAIDPITHLSGQKVWLFSGYNDGTVHRPAMDAVAGYYENYVAAGNVFYKTNSPAQHAFVTDDFGLPCSQVDPNYINNCNYDAAGELLEYIYGHLAARSGTPSEPILEFDQTEFLGGVNPKAIGLADKGYVYVPKACQGQACRVHVVFHGCQQYAGRIGDALYAHAGYNRWADTNRLIVLYPQTVATDGGLAHPDEPMNPRGCWDWWGYSPLPGNDGYARKTGFQIAAVRAMLDRLAQNYAPGKSSDTFGTPQDFIVGDSTASAVALEWKPNTAASGFNIYRSSTGTGTFTKINSQPVPGASFADRGLAASTTYHYKVTAIANGVESAPTSPITAATTADPPACDPYFSDNVTHVTSGRAWSNLTDAFALGSNNPMGQYNNTTFSHLLKESLVMYRVGYCP